MALRSNVFHKENVAEVLNPPSTWWARSSSTRAMPSRSRFRPNISVSVDEHDVFGAQQQSAIERLSIPTYVEAPEMAPALSAGHGGGRFIPGRDDRGLPHEWAADTRSTGGYLDAGAVVSVREQVNGTLRLGVTDLVGHLNCGCTNAAKKACHLTATTWPHW